jgi:glycosyltransferase involved in cell wall biosynthesis
MIKTHISQSEDAHSLQNKRFSGGVCAGTLANEKLVTIITVVFNAKAYLEETIKSIVNHLSSNIEYIIIDGGSTDGTLDIIHKYEHAINYWISEKDDGIYDAMNKAKKMSSGKWLLYINAGDILLADFSLALENILSVDDGVVAVLAGVNVCDEFGRFLFVKRASIRGGRNFLFKMPACHQGIFYRRLPMKQFDLGYQIISDKVHLYEIYKDYGISSIYTLSLVVSSYRLGGYSEKMRAKYHAEESRFFSLVSKSGRIGELLAIIYVNLKFILFRVLKSSGIWLVLKKRIN